MLASSWFDVAAHLFFPRGRLCSRLADRMRARKVLGDASPQHSRILQGVIEGLGFLGAGAILKTGGRATGTATAASIWNVAVIGAAVGYGLIDVGLVLSLVNVLALRGLPPLKALAIRPPEPRASA